MDLQSEEEGQLRNYLNRHKRQSERVYSTQNSRGYWSNLSKQQNSALLSMLGTRTTQECIKSTQPALLDVIFSSKRGAALELLELNGAEIAVDLGCMWGALTIPLARQAKYVLGVDQTLESLKFAAARVAEEGLGNVSFLCANLQDIDFPQQLFDVAIVNGVLEWIPEVEPIVVGEYWYGAQQRENRGNPGEMQLLFLKRVHHALKCDGRLMLAIENRYDYKMFCGVKDPHSGTYFTTISPRWMANIISNLAKKRAYRPWIYSFKELNDLLLNAGFKSVKLHACWPDYRFPAYIAPYGCTKEGFAPTSTFRNGKRSLKRIVANRLEWLLFKRLNLDLFAPSIIAIAGK